MNLISSKWNESLFSMNFCSIIGRILWKITYFKKLVLFYQAQSIDKSIKGLCRQKIQISFDIKMNQDYKRTNTNVF